MAHTRLFALLCVAAFLCNGFSHRRFNGRFSEIPVTVQDYWFEQRLDHFAGADSRVWKQRYYMNESFSSGDGPVFLMIGGEGTANPAWMTQGTWMTYAEKMGALCFLLEHRFYGKSHPTEKWIVFGGSYPGCLAAWYRLKFPHLAHAAVASSAPVQAVLNFSEYLDVVQSSLARNHSNCPKTFKLASDTLIELLDHKENYAKITRDFNLCNPLEINSKMDLSFFLDTIAEYIMDVVQYNNDNREFEGVKNTNITIQVVCDIMANEVLGSPYDRYVEVIHTITKAAQEKCIEASYQAYVQDMRDCRWEGAASTGGRQWMYQTCTEFGYFQSSDSTSQPFSGFPLR
uniref:Serine protease K12H4.7 n=1 Tax=Pyxicephalus adspersus TaxID=30357 RepID=A0AAV3A4Q6_PYXAD|nr:TPA: hypothetical protein GDO54_010325 [Pyxicephalus adspersus]